MTLEDAIRDYLSCTKEAEEHRKKAERASRDAGLLFDKIARSISSRVVRRYGRSVEFLVGDERYVLTDRDLRRAEDESPQVLSPKETI